MQKRKIKRSAECSMLVISIIAVIALLIIGLGYVGLLYTQPGIDRNAVFLSTSTVLISGIMIGVAGLTSSVRYLRGFAYLLMLSSLHKVASSLKTATSADLGADMLVVLSTIYAGFLGLALVLRLIHSPIFDERLKAIRR